MRNAGLEEAQAGIKIARRNINNPGGHRNQQTECQSKNYLAVCPRQAWESISGARQNIPEVLGYRVGLECY